MQVGNIIDYCIYDTSEIIPEYLRRYNMQGYELIEQDIQKVKNLGIKVMQRSVSSIQGEFIRHDPSLIAQSIIELVCEDLKFKDKQNDTKYMLLNDRLKSSKKHNEKIVKNKKKSEKKRAKGKSKFYSKYQERIESIQESDIKLKEKEKLNKIQEKMRNKEKDKLSRMEESLRRKTKDIKEKTKINKLNQENLKNKESITDSKKTVQQNSKKKKEDTNRITKQINNSLDEENDISLMIKQNKIDKLNEQDRKQIIDTINKLRR